VEHWNRRFVSPQAIKALPKADLHCHLEDRVRLERLIARDAGLPPRDWQVWLDSLAQMPPGMPRLQTMADLAYSIEEHDETPESLYALLVECLSEWASEGARYGEVRFAGPNAFKPYLMEVFVQAQRAAKHQWGIEASAVLIINLTNPSIRERTGDLFEAAISMESRGLAGIDLIPHPYDKEGGLGRLVPWCARAAESGLGITCHAGEFSEANVAQALDMPSVTRIGHGIKAVERPDLVDRIVDKGVTLEVCLTSNVVLGAVGTYQQHPLRRLLDAGVRVALGSDCPLRFCTNIGREYEAAVLYQGLGADDLHRITLNAVDAAFLSPPERAVLRAEVDAEYQRLVGQ
jgi:adenosine deaminase